MTESSGEAEGAAALSYVRVASEYVAVLAAIVYGTGFVVVSYYLARKGIVSFSILRPKIFGAGLAFLVFASVPLISAFQWFSILGFSFQPLMNQAHSSRTRIYRS